MIFSIAFFFSYLADVNKKRENSRIWCGWAWISNKICLWFFVILLSFFITNKREKKTYFFLLNPVQFCTLMIFGSINKILGSNQIWFVQKWNSICVNVICLGGKDDLLWCNEWWNDFGVGASERKMLKFVCLLYISIDIDEYC